MKISKTQLKEIIKEELEAVLSEEEETLEEIWPFGKKKKLGSNERRELMGEYPYDPDPEENPNFNPEDPRLSGTQKLQAKKNKREYEQEQSDRSGAEQAYQRKKAREAEPKFRPPEEVRREKEKEKERQAAFSRELDRKHRERYASDFDVPPGGYGRYQGSGQGSRSSAESAPWNESKKKLTKE